MQHCKQRLFYVKQLQKEKELIYRYVDNQYMAADIGTKNLDAPTLQ